MGRTPNWCRPWKTLTVETIVCGRKGEAGKGYEEKEGICQTNGVGEVT